MWDTGMSRSQIDLGDWATLGASLVDQLRALGLAPAEIQFLSVSHGHRDHATKPAPGDAATTADPGRPWGIGEIRIPGRRSGSWTATALGLVSFGGWTIDRAARWPSCSPISRARPASVLTVIAILGLTWIAGRIYSNSVLRLGARVRFRDALRGSSGPQPSPSRRTWVMPRLPLILAIVSAILIVVGRLGKRWPVAIAGFVLLALAGLLVVLGWGNG
jgi:hypothetical protein